ncbi:hypothetical protein N9985_00950 [Gammaproteobacteria bacterium]|nr:hypothetical protein [Gammaproteobacteria bacterium]
MNALIIIVALSLSAYLAFAPRLARSLGWQATATPLASIMGSGFLVSAPLLAGIVGNLALLSMMVLLLLAYLVGEVMRFNIRHFEPIENEQGSTQKVAFLSRMVLVGAYFISVSYYLQLLAAFLLSSLGIESEYGANLISSAFILAICGIGIWKGLEQLGGIEKYAVSLNLGMIGALLVALAVYNLDLLQSGSWALADVDSTINLGDLRVLLGLLIVVQGFETSRYLGDLYPAEQRISTMRWAQLISSAIYILFIGLATVLFHDGLGSDVTAIMTMAAPVAVVLPVLLAVAAIGSQFSAAVADSEGAGGLLEDVTNRRLPMRYAYLLIMLITLVLTWETDVNVIIAYASRAFALFYCLQSWVALLTARSMAKRSLGREILFAAVAVLCLTVFLFGIPSG